MSILILDVNTNMGHLRVLRRNDDPDHAVLYNVEMNDICVSTNSDAENVMRTLGAILSGAFTGLPVMSDWVYPAILPETPGWYERRHLHEQVKRYWDGESWRRDGANGPVVFSGQWDWRGILRDGEITPLNGV